MADTELIVRIAAQDTATRQVRQLQSSIIRLVGAVASLTAAFRALTFPVQEAIEFERALADVQKTTDFADESIQALGVSLRELSTETGVAAVELAEIAARAGQLGLGRQGQAAILAFTDTVARFAVVADLSVDQAATSIAKIANIFQIPIDQSERVASAFNELSNTTTATADQLIDVVRRVGDASGLLNFEESLGLAAQALELGQTPEVAGTAIIKTFSNAQTQAEEFARVLGVTTEEWARAVQTDGVGAIQDVAFAISQLGQLEQGVLIKDLFGGGRQFAFGAKLVADASNNFTILSRTVSDATRAFAEATSAQLEYERISNTTSRQTDILIARARDLAIQFGEVLNPVIRDIVESLQEFLSDEAVQGRVLVFAEAVRDAVENLAEWVAALGEAEGAFTTFLNVIKAFVAIGLAQILTAIVGRVITFGARLAVLTRVARTAAASVDNLKNIIGQLAAGLSLAEIAAGRGGGFNNVAATAARATSQLSRNQRTQNALLERRNQLERDFRILRVQAIRDARAQAAAAGQSAEAQIRRGRAVREALGTLGGAGTAQRASTSRELERINTQYTVLNRNLQTVRRSAGQTATGFNRIIGVVGRLGGVIARFVSGPLGLLLTFFGGPIIAAVSNFFGAFNDEVEESAARTRAQLENTRREIEASIGAFREGLTNRTEPVSLNFTGNVDEFNSRISRGAAALQSLTQQIRGARNEEEALLQESFAVSRRIEEINRQLEQRAQQQERVNQTFAPSARAEALESIQSEIDTLTSERTEFESIRAALNEEIGAVRETEADLQTRQTAQLAQLAQGISDIDVAAIQIQRNLALTTDEIATLEQQLGGLRQEINNTSDEGERLDLRRQAARTSAAIAELRQRAEALQATYEETGSQVTRTFGSIVDVLTEVEDGVLAINDIQFAGFAEELIQGAQDGGSAFNDLQDALAEAIRQTAVYEAQSRVFDVVTDRVRETRDALQGVFDNLRTSAQATQNRISEIGRELDGLPRQRNIDILLRQIDEAGTGGFAERQIERLEAQIQRQLDIAANAEGQAARVARGRARELQQRREALLVEQQNNDVIREKAQLEQNFQRAIEEGNRLQTEAADLREQIANAPDGNTPEDIQRREELAQRVLRLNEALRANQREVEQTAQAYGQFDGVIALDIFNPDAIGGLRSAVEESDIVDIQRQLEESTDRTLGTQAALVTETRDLANENVKAAEAANRFTQLVAQGNEQVRNLSQALGVTNEELAQAQRTAQLFAENLDTSRRAAEALAEVQVAPRTEIPTGLPTDQELQVASESIAGAVSDATQIAVRNSIRQGVQDGTQEVEPVPIPLDQQFIATQTQDALTAGGPYQIDLEGNLSGAAAGQGFAEGGFVSGPGTSTSDSIFARLSNGEFVMDALTTRVFGPGFFRSLQKAARGGALQLPRFQNGGLVGATSALEDRLSQLAEVDSRSGGREEVDINFNVGGESVRLTGGRDEVNQLTKALRNISRGGGR